MVKSILVLDGVAILGTINVRAVPVAIHKNLQTAEKQICTTFWCPPPTVLQNCACVMQPNAPPASGASGFGQGSGFGNENGQGSGSGSKTGGGGSGSGSSNSGSSAIVN